MAAPEIHIAALPPGHLVRVELERLYIGIYTPESSSSCVRVDVSTAQYGPSSVFFIKKGNMGAPLLFICKMISR